MPREYWPTREWRTADPASLGVNPDSLALLEWMVNSQYRNISGAAIVRRGFIVWEKYFNGGGPLDANNVASVTKSVRTLEGTRWRSRRIILSESRGVPANTQVYHAPNGPTANSFHA